MHYISYINIMERLLQLLGHYRTDEDIPVGRCVSELAVLALYLSSCTEI